MKVRKQQNIVVRLGVMLFYVGMAIEVTSRGLVKVGVHKIKFYTLKIEVGIFMEA